MLCCRGDTGAMAGGAGMHVIRDLKAKGFRVIAYEDGAGSWPIKTKCLPLLAGAIQLFDSSRTEFPHELRETIERIVRVESAERSDEHKIRTSCMLGNVGESAGMMAFSGVIRFSALSDLPVTHRWRDWHGKEALARAVP